MPIIGSDTEYTNGYVDSYPLGNVYLGSNQVIGTFPKLPIPTTNLLWNVDANDPASYPGSGSVWYNTVGNYANLLFTGSVTYSGDSNGNYFSLDTGSYYSTSNITASVTNRTYCSWIYSTSNNPPQYFQYGTDSVSYNYLALNNGNWFEMKSAGLSFIKSIQTGSIPQNQWHFIAGTIATNGDNALYYNGDLNNSGNIGYVVRTDRPILGDMRGRIGQISMYNAVLSDSDIKTYFNNTRAYYGV